MADLILLLEVSSLKSDKGKKLNAWPNDWKCSHDLPNLSDQIVDGVPGHRAVSDEAPPTHQVGRFDIGVDVQVVRGGNFRIPEGWSNETNTEFRSVWGGGWRRCGCGKVVEKANGKLLDVQ